MASNHAKQWIKDYICTKETVVYLMMNETSQYFKSLLRNRQSE